MIKMLPKAMMWVSAAVLWILPVGLWGAETLQALPYGAGTYGSCQYSTCSISILSGGTVSLGVSPTSSGVYTIASDSVSVETNASTGYTLSLRDADTNTSLVNGANAVVASDGTPAIPVQLAMNTWGWRIDGLAGFGAGPTSVQNSVASSSLTFAGVPASNQASRTLRSTAAAANPAETTAVWYGVRIDTTKPAGTYSTQVVYTAVTNN